MTRIKEIESKSILTKSKLPDTDYVVNPYVGCAFGCHYCYASFMSRMVNEPNDEWGNYVYVKKNAVELFRKNINSLRNKNASILLSSVTDPYQGAEAKYKITREILEILAEIEYPGLVSVLTKSSLVTRDIDVLKKLKNVEVGLTITSTDDNLSRFMEVRASNVSARIKALQKLNDAGLNTYVFVGPLMPHFATNHEALEELFKQIAETGTKDLYVEHLNMKPYIMARLRPELEKEPENIQNLYKYKEAVRTKVHELIKKYDLNLRLDETIEHGK